MNDADEVKQSDVDTLVDILREAGGALTILPFYERAMARIVSKYETTNVDDITPILRVAYNTGLIEIRSSGYITLSGHRFPEPPADLLE